MERPSERSRYYKHSGLIVNGLLAAVGLLATTCAIGPRVSAAEVSRIPLTAPEGSVTPLASGTVGVEVLSRNADHRVELLISGELQGLVPERDYKVWACWDTEHDCSAHADPIRTNQQGAAMFNGLRFDTFNRPQNPVTSLQVRQETSGLIPADACFVGATPCLRAPVSIQ